jgi:hypothetical protein
LHSPTLGKARSQVLVDDRFEWSPGAPRFGLQALGNVVVQG